YDGVTFVILPTGEAVERPNVLVGNRLTNLTSSVAHLNKSEEVAVLNSVAILVDGDRSLVVRHLTRGDVSLLVNGVGVERKPLLEPNIDGVALTSPRKFTFWRNLGELPPNLGAGSLVHHVRGKQRLDTIG